MNVFFAIYLATFKQMNDTKGENIKLQYQNSKSNIYNLTNEENWDLKPILIFRIILNLTVKEIYEA